ncbi:MAG: helix-turn-helix domain-containing protein, partial [Pseudomonadota bacterium]
ISETSSVLEVMLMRPATYSYALAIIGEALFMMLAISTLLRAMRQEHTVAESETETLRDALIQEKEDSARRLGARAAQIEALTETLTREEKTALQTAADQFADRARQSVIENIRVDAFGPKTLAAQMAVSEKTLGRRLKEARELSPAAFIRSVRLSFARDLILLEKLDSVSEVAHAAGFSSARHFAKLYKSEFSETPSETFRALSSS